MIGIENIVDQIGCSFSDISEQDECRMGSISRMAARNRRLCSTLPRMEKELVYNMAANKFSGVDEFGGTTFVTTHHPDGNAQKIILNCHYLLNGERYARGVPFNKLFSLTPYI